MESKQENSLETTTIQCFKDDLKLLKEVKKNMKMIDLKSTLHWILAIRLPNCEDLSNMLWDSATEPEKPEKYVFEVRGLGRQGKKEVKLLGKVENNE